MSILLQTALLFSVSLLLMIAVLPPIPSKPPTPTMDYFQTDNKITINIYTKRYKKNCEKHK